MGIITRNFANNVLSSGTLDATDGIDGVIPSSNIANASVTNITELPAAIEVIESVATDPGSPDEGEVWYNSTDNVIRLRSVSTAGTWASGGSFPPGGTLAGAGFGSQTATIVAGGTNPAVTSSSFTYDGTSWSPSPSLNTARAGLMSSSNAPQISGVVFGGYTIYPTMLDATENWNGTAWTSNPTGLNTARQGGGGAGIQTAAICVGGEIPGPSGTNSNAVENYNGTSWTTSPATFPSSGPGTKGFGLQTAAIFIKSGVSQSWNGTAFSSAGTQNNPSDNRGVFGTQTAGVAAGVQASPITGATEIWNGTSWTTNPNSLSTARYFGIGTGTQSSGLISAGYSGSSPYTTAVEEWTGPGVATTKTVTVS